MRIVEDDLTGAEIADLLRYHLAEANRNSPPNSVFAFDIDRLRAPDMTFWSAWDGNQLAGCAALREIALGHGEVKSMRTSPTHLRKGVATQLIEHLTTKARERGYIRLSLETGSGDAYEPALALYRRHGFIAGEAFGDYERSAFNQFFHLDL